MSFRMGIAILSKIAMGRKILRGDDYSDCFGSKYAERARYFHQ